LINQFGVDVGDRRDRRWNRLLLVGGGLILLVWWTVWIVGSFLGTPVAASTTYSWPASSTIEVTNQLTGLSNTCTVRTANRPDRTVTIAPRAGSHELYGIAGVRVRPGGSGQAQLTCREPVQVSAGARLWLFPIAGTPYPMVVGLVMVGVWQVRARGRLPRGRIR
jgi:hypothetical protein